MLKYNLKDASFFLSNPIIIKLFLVFIIYFHCLSCILYKSTNNSNKYFFFVSLERQFISVLGRQIRNQIGLSDQEISELADYFRVQDGRIFYTQLCEVIHKSGKDSI